MLSLILRNLFFTILQPGVVTVFVPWLLVDNVLDGALHPTRLGLFGLVLIAAGWTVV